MLKNAGMLILSIGLFWTTACHKAEPANSNANSTPVNSSSTTANTPSPAARASTPTPETTSTVITKATPTDTYKTGYAALKNKDIATLKKIMSKDALAFLTDMGSAENKTLDDLLKEMTVIPQAATAEVRNEKI